MGTAECVIFVGLASPTSECCREAGLDSPPSVEATDEESDVPNAAGGSLRASSIANGFKAAGLTVGVRIDLGVSGTGRTTGVVPAEAWVPTADAMLCRLE